MLVGETTGRPKGERVPGNIAHDTRRALTDLLYHPQMLGVGYSEFINRAIAAARQELEQGPLVGVTAATYEEIEEQGHPVPGKPGVRLWDGHEYYSARWL